MRFLKRVRAWLQGRAEREFKRGHDRATVEIAAGNRQKVLDDLEWDCALWGSPGHQERGALAALKEK